MSIEELNYRIAKLERTIALLTTQTILGRNTAGTGPVEQLDGATVRTMIGAGTGSGSVTSVALSLPGVFTVSGSPVTTAGTLSGALVTQAANLVWAGPTSGGAAAPTFRALVDADFPSALNTSSTAQSKSGNLGLGVTPTQKLDVSGTSRFGGEVWLYNSAAPSNRKHFKLAHATDGTTRIMTLQDDLTTSYQTWFVFNPGAGIDVGGSLDVTGSVNASTNLTASGVVTATGGGAHTLGQIEFSALGTGGTAEVTMTFGGDHPVIQWTGNSSSPGDGTLDVDCDAVAFSGFVEVRGALSIPYDAPSVTTGYALMWFDKSTNKLKIWNNDESDWKEVTLT